MGKSDSVDMRNYVPKVNSENLLPVALSKYLNYVNYSESRGRVIEISKAGSELRNCALALNALQIKTASNRANHKLT